MVDAEHKIDTQLVQTPTGLLACPFCGQLPIGPEHGDSAWWIDCRKCEFTMDDESKKRLVTKWNSRVK